MKAAAQGKKKEVPAKKPAGAAGGAAPSPMAKHGNTPVSGPSTNTRSYLYDEESDKYKSLTVELEQLEHLGETSASPQKSSSRELAITLKNLKRLDTTVK
ncbi:unnamed protein product, partial [Nesidiocoris tenuis]